MGHQTDSVHEHKSHKKSYIIIFVVLAVLTALEIWAAEIPGLSKFQKGSALTGLALGKALSCGFTTICTLMKKQSGLSSSQLSL